MLFCVRHYANVWDTNINKLHSQSLKLGQGDSKKAGSTFKS